MADPLIGTILLPGKMFGITAFLFLVRSSSHGAEKFAECLWSDINCLRESKSIFFGTFFGRHKGDIRKKFLALVVDFSKKMVMRFLPVFVIYVENAFF